MNITVSNSAMLRRLRSACLALLLLSAGPLVADEGAADRLALPEARHLAASLSDPESRGDTLITLAALHRLMDYGRFARPHELSDYAARFLDDRAWLDRLASQYTNLPARSSLFDPASWLLLLELDVHDLSPGPAVSPFGPGTEALLAQLFDRTRESSAITVLPEVLSRMEAGSTVLWSRVLEAADENVALAMILQDLNEDWFDPWHAAEPPAPGALQAGLPVVDGGLALLEEFAGTSRRAGPPDALVLKRLRYSLLEALPSLGWQQSLDAAYLLNLATAVDGLYREEYIAFTEAMLWVGASLLAYELPVESQVEEPAADSPFMAVPEIVLELLPGENPPPVPYRSPLPGALTGMLPALSSAFATGFASVDPRIGVALASVFDVVQNIHGGRLDADQLNSLRMGIADSVAQLVLLIPDMDHYFTQPVRSEISGEINICVSMAASRNELGISTLQRDQFERCLRNLAGLAATVVRSSELSGDPDGPFGTEQLRRELMLTPWQRINYLSGYLYDHYTTGCDEPRGDLPNPLEWSSLVAAITWFARQSPVYFRSPENEAVVESLRQQGRDMLEALGRQVDCISGAGTGVNDPVQRGLADYREVFDELVAALREAELRFREERLMPGADVVLTGGAEQRTAYRPEDLEIGPCDERYICEMASTLEPSVALLNLFPEPYLVADQTGLGTVGICYENVQWVQRRSQPVREDDPHVANYFGHLSFDLVGTYTENEERQPVFAFNFVSPDEYHYLFGPQTDEVLNAACPMEWVGSRIVTGLGDDRVVRVVPDRLTYLSAARSLPSRLMAGNWNGNQRWQDAIISLSAARRLEVEADETIGDRVEQHLQGLYQAGQTALYNALLRPPVRRWRVAEDPLYGLLQELSTHKALVRSYVNLFYPQFLIDSNEIRGALEGSGALLDEAVIRQFRGDNVALSSLYAGGTERYGNLLTHWGRQPESVRRKGTVATGLAHAIIRLDRLYQDFFAPPPPLPPAPVSREDRLDFGELDG